MEVVLEGFDTGILSYIESLSQVSTYRNSRTPRMLKSCTCMSTLRGHINMYTRIAIQKIVIEFGVCKCHVRESYLREKIGLKNDGSKCIKKEHDVSTCAEGKVGRKCRLCGEVGHNSRTCKSKYFGKI